MQEMQQLILAGVVRIFVFLLILIDTQIFKAANIVELEA